MADDLQDRYRTPGDPLAFAGRSKLRSVLSKEGAPLSREAADAFLSTVDGYTQHRQFKRPRQFNPYYVRAKRVQIQCDLIDVSRLAEYNDGVKYLIVFIDVFTRKMWVFPAENKTGSLVAEIFDAFLDVYVGPRKPLTIFCDRGTELKNQFVKRVLSKWKIKMLHPNSAIKAALVERVNLTLQRLIYTYMTENETRRYIDALSLLVQTYNKRPHRAFKDVFSPDDAEQSKNAFRVKDIHERRYAELDEKKAKRTARSLTRFKVGDIVRIVRLPTRFQRGYETSTTGEYFTIVEVNTTQSVPLFTLKSMNTDEVIQGGFYEAELTKVDPESVFKVERVIKRRRYRGRKQMFVKWLHFDDRHNSWINEEDVVRVFDN